MHRSRTTSALATAAVVLSSCTGSIIDDRTPLELRAATTTTTTPTTTTQPPAPTTTVVTTHEIVAGDTLGGLAGRYDTTVAELVEANELTDPDSVAVGDVLIVGIARPGDDLVEHEVQAGESLLEIAAIHGTSAEAIVDANGLRNANDLAAGQLLVIPDGPAPPPEPAGPISPGDVPGWIVDEWRRVASELVASRGDAVSEAPLDTPPVADPGPSTTLGDTGRRHVVAPGDVLGSIAERHGVGLSELIAANNLADPDRLAVGDELIIPG